ncbi:hypothetical protein LXL04_001951 [Taraxacum kok-saghyz]
MGIGDATERRDEKRRLSVVVLMDGDGFWPRAKTDDNRNERKKKEPIERKKRFPIVLVDVVQLLGKYGWLPAGLTPAEMS